MGLGNWIERKAMGKIAAVILGKAADGSFGPQVKSIYWWLAGKKTAIAAIFGVLWAILSYLTTHGGCGATGCASYLAILQTLFGWLSAAGLVVGQLDGALRSDAPKG